MASWSSSLNRSVQPRKQRLYQYIAPLHIAGHFLHAPLSEELRKKYTRRSLRVRTGDKVKILRGQFKGTVGVIHSVSVIRRRVFVEGVGITKRDGSKSLYPLSASKLQILELQLDDKYRKASLEHTKLYKKEAVAASTKTSKGGKKA